MPTAAPMFRPPWLPAQRDYQAERALRLTDKDQQAAAKIRSSARWKQLRALVLAGQPLCADPYGEHGHRPVLAVEVDHIVPLVQALHMGFDQHNLQGLCKACHARKSGEERCAGPSTPSKL